MPNPERADGWDLRTAIMRTAREDLLALVRRDLEYLRAHGLQPPEWWALDDATPPAAPLAETAPPEVPPDLLAGLCRTYPQLYPILEPPCQDYQFVLGLLFNLAWIERAFTDPAL